jgi:hypothetical protein
MMDIDTHRGGCYTDYIRFFTMILGEKKQEILCKTT